MRQLKHRNHVEHINKVEQSWKHSNGCKLFKNIEDTIKRRGVVRCHVNDVSILISRQIKELLSRQRCTISAE
ncbi:CLUMA_CG006141, isoform A [Clunio marinus]|uniref:CLUMA_CG006141, isoform A n=1 Tax=Clunio marinus TaxID=568069 RepID=A0A1J1HZ18_9DIPT|nr:CLUMA_CG006141, isoform A [Clunio marinus]